MTDTIRLTSIGGFTPEHSALDVKVLTDISAIDDFLAGLKQSHREDSRLPGGRTVKGEFFKKHGYTLVKIDKEFFFDCCSLDEDEIEEVMGAYASEGDFLNEVTFPFDFDWVSEVPYKHWDEHGNEIPTVSGWLFIPIHCHPDAVGVYQMDQPQD